MTPAVAFIDKYLRGTPGLAAIRQTVEQAASLGAIQPAAIATALAEMESDGTIVIDLIDGQAWIFHSAAQDEADEASVASLWADQKDPVQIVKGALVAAGFRSRSSRRSYRLVGLFLDQALARVPENTGFHDALVDVRNHVDFISGRLV
jgi:hypothetical protein